MKGKLILTRHHESEWNKLGLWTGLRNRPMTPYGFQKSREMGALLKGVRIDYAFYSALIRTAETLNEILEALDQPGVPTERSAALNERDYGEYTGKNKWDMQKLIGEENWNKVRREWDYPVPGGETLKMVYNRTVPFFLSTILPHVRAGETVLVVAHGNSCRSIIKYVEQISDEGIRSVEMPFGCMITYTLDDDGHMVDKKVQQVESNVNA